MLTELENQNVKGTLKSKFKCHFNIRFSKEQTSKLKRNFKIENWKLTLQSKFKRNLKIKYLKELGRNFGELWQNWEFWGNFQFGVF